MITLPEATCPIARKHLTKTYQMMYAKQHTYQPRKDKLICKKCGESKPRFSMVRRNKNSCYYCADCNSKIKPYITLWSRLLIEVSCKICLDWTDRERAHQAKGFYYCPACWGKK